MQKQSFQAEIQQVLDIVINSLYTDKEVFVRELISNASDACEKVRFIQSSGQQAFQGDKAPSISISLDEKAKKVIFTDTGCGMTKDELIENLGTVAHSGTKAFLKKAKEEKENSGNNTQAQDSLIGQFGVGFYSAFMVAKQVTVYTRSWKANEKGWKWTCSGMDGYEIEEVNDLDRGTRIELELKDDASNFAQQYEMERILKRYSSFVQFPISLNGKEVNTIQAIWARSKADIKPEEYTEFYKYISHDSRDPLLKLHFTADAPLLIQSLLYVPDSNIEKMGFMHLENGVSLYCRRILIAEGAKAKGLLPEWMRFVKGVVDSADLPLNISRESMQDSSLMKKLENIITKRFLKFLDETAKNDIEKYNKFYEEFGRMLKEGILSDFEYREPLAKLLRFESSATESGKTTSLSDYVMRMSTEQKEIYYLIAPHRKAAEASPYYEGLKAKNLEVLFCYDPADSFLMENLMRFEEKELKPAEQADISIEQTSGEKLNDDQCKHLTEWFKELLGDKIKEVKISHRLVDSPAAIVSSDKYMTTAMKRILKSIRKDELSGSADYNLEINPANNVICQLYKAWDANKAIAPEIAQQVYDNACITAGIIDDFSPLVKRINNLMEQTLKQV
jgi:molecular chaperone HtpG